MRGFRGFSPIPPFVLLFLLAACAAVPPPSVPAPPAVERERPTTAEPAETPVELPPVDVPLDEKPPAALPEIPAVEETPQIEFEEAAAIAPVVQPGIGILAPAAASLLTPASRDALSEFLETRIEATGGTRIRERHYLWFLRRGDDLVLSGSDTEIAEDFQRLVKIGEANELFLLGKLRRLS